MTDCGLSFCLCHQLMKTTSWKKTKQTNQTICDTVRDNPGGRFQRGTIMKRGTFCSSMLGHEQSEVFTSTCE